MSREVVDRYFDLWSRKQYDESAKLLHDDLSFHGPIDTFNESKSFVAAVKRLGPIVKQITTRKVFEDGPDVCIIYDFVTNTPAGTVPIAEWFHVEGHRIKSILTIFDARPFAPMLGGGGASGH